MNDTERLVKLVPRDDSISAEELEAMELYVNRVFRDWMEEKGREAFIEHLALTTTSRLEKNVSRQTITGVVEIPECVLREFDVEEAAQRFLQAELRELEDALMRYWEGSRGS